MATKKVWKQLLIFVIAAVLFAIIFSVTVLNDDMILILQSLAVFGGAIGLVGLCIGFNSFRLTKLTKTCSESTEGELLSVLMTKTEDDIRVPASYEFKYDVKGIEYREYSGDVEGVSPETPLGTKVRIWYDPNNPVVFFVADDQTLRHDIVIGRSVLGVSIFLVIAGIIAFISI